jgi:hypothetical protein
MTGNYSTKTRCIPTCVVFWIFVIFLLFHAEVLPQPDKKNPVRKKDFGKSLKRYDLPAEKSKQAQSSDADEIRVETDLVVTDALVIDAKGSLVAGLNRDDFIVREDGIVQDIELFAPAANNKLAKSIVLITDSNSFSAERRRNLEAIRSLINWLGPNDRLAIVSDNLKLLTDFTSDKKVLQDALNPIKRPHGPSWREFSSLLAVINELLSGNDVRPIILFQVRGDEALLLRPIWSAHEAICKRSGRREICERAFSLKDVLSVVEQSRVTIYGIIPSERIVGLQKEEQTRRIHTLLDIFSDEAHNRTDEKERASFREKWKELTLRETEAMQQSVLDVTNVSGGFTTFLESTANFVDIYSSIFKTIDNRYTVGYYSKADWPTNVRRTVTLEVKDRPEYVVLSRKSYVPRRDSR